MAILADPGVPRILALAVRLVQPFVRLSQFGQQQRQKADGGLEF